MRGPQGQLEVCISMGKKVPSEDEERRSSLANKGSLSQAATAKREHDVSRISTYQPVLVEPSGAD